MTGKGEDHAMNKKEFLPGTLMRCPEGTDPATLLDGLFIAGGLVLSQVSALTGLEGYTVQNWVQRGFVTPTVGKRYSMDQFCRLVTINLLKDSLSLGQIAGLLSAINGKLDDESDDMIDDALLYIYFVRICFRMEGFDREELQRVAKEVTADFAEPKEGAAGRLREVLGVMYAAYLSSVYRRTAEEMLNEISPE